MGAAAVLYVAYFVVGVLLDVLMYATGSVRGAIPTFIPWKEIFDTAQILIAVGAMRLFMREYDPKTVLVIFAALMGATLVALFAFTPEMANASKSGGLAQFFIAITICALLLWKA